MNAVKEAWRQQVVTLHCEYMSSLIALTVPSLCKDKEIKNYNTIPKNNTLFMRPYSGICNKYYFTHYIHILCRHVDHCSLSGYVPVELQLMMLMDRWQNKAVIILTEPLLNGK